VYKSYTEVTGKKLIKGSASVRGFLLYACCVNLSDTC